MDDVVVQFDAVTRRFGATEALRGLSARVPAGSVTALLGRNASGKTTLLRCAVNLLRPDSGRVAVFGVGSTQLGPAEFSRIGYVSERQQLDPRLTVARTIEWTRSFYSESRSWDDALAADLTRRLDLDPNARVGSLSLGQSRKLSLLLNLAYRPQLLVLDEPAANLDAIVRREFLELILDRLRDEGLTALFSTHHLTDVERVADRVILIEDGRCRVERGLDDLKDRVKTLRLRARDGGIVAEPKFPDGAAVLRVRRTSADLQITIDGYDDGLPSRLREVTGADVDVIDLPLEDVFIAYGQSRVPATLEEVRA